MNKKIVSGCILSATLLILISITPTIYANVDRVPINNDYDRSLDRLELGNIVFKLFFNNMRLVFLLLFAPSNPSESYLRVVYNRCLDAFKSLDNNELDLLFDSVDLEVTEVKDNLMFVLDNDLDFDNLLEENDCLDCDCNSDIIDLNWSFPIICSILFIPFLFGYILFSIDAEKFQSIYLFFMWFTTLNFIGWIILEYCDFYSFNLNYHCFWEDWNPVHPYINY